MTAGIELRGLNADSLDAYLRALGTMRLADRVFAGLRWSWTDREVLAVHGVTELDELAAQMAAAVRDDPTLLPPVETPWRGKQGKGTAFRELRAEADERLLDWFDACAVPRLGEDDKGSRHNPLVGRGGGFGHVDIPGAFRAAVKRIGPDAKRPDRVARALAASVSASALDTIDARSVQVTKKALGAYQSGRATGPGSSVLDEAPSSQRAASSAWDVVLMLEGLRVFRGTATRRAGTEQASFPLLVRAEAVGLEGANAHQDRVADDYEVLAPLWLAPARARTVLSMIARARLRLAAGDRTTIATDALEALVAQAGITVGGLGFDRCVRFALYVPSDRRHRFAVRRGTVRARGSVSASLVADSLVRFLRAQARLEPCGERRTAAHRRAEQELREAVAAFAARGDDAPAARRLLSRLVDLETIAARLHAQRDLALLALADIGPRWDRVATRREDRSWRIARALAWTACAPGDGADSWLRPVLLQQQRGIEGWRLSPEVAVPDLIRGSQPADRLLKTLLRHAVRPDSGEPRGSSLAVSLEDLNWLLADDGPDLDDVARLTVVAARIRQRLDEHAEPASLGPPEPQGRLIARVLLAAQPAVEDQRVAWRRGDIRGTPHPALARRARLSALAGAGQVDALIREATVELWRRGLNTPLTSGRALLTIDRARLALALFLPLTPDAVATLAAQFPTEEESE